MRVEFVEWKGKQLRECDLPPGVRYSLPTAGKAEFIACQDRSAVMVLDRHGELSWTVHGVCRRDYPVTILDWPDWCGPRPNDTVTGDDIANNAPDGDGWLAVFCYKGTLGTFGLASEYEGGQTTHSDFAGYLRFVND